MRNPFSGELPNTLADRNRIPELDGLRGVAIGMVVIYHFFQATIMVTPGTALSYLQAAARLSWSGVDLFFVLSGFLIGGILLDARDSTNYYRIFYQRRFFRIVPLYVATLLIVPAMVSLVQAAYGNSLKFWLTTDGPPWYAYWTFTQNFWMTHLGSFSANGLGMTWSLAVEEQFYLTVPLYIRALSRRWLLRSVVVGVCSAPVLRSILAVYWPQDSVGTYTMMLCRADALLLGVLAAILLRDERWKERIRNSSRGFAIAAPVLLLGLGVLTLRGGNFASPLMKSVGYTWLGLSYFTLLLFAVTRPGSILSKVLRFRWLGWMGTLAYGIYLIHQPVQYLLYGIFLHQGPAITGGASFLVGVAALSLSLVLAVLSWRYFEQPLIRLGRRTTFDFGVARPVEAPASGVRLVPG
jgi:peptidoglycan/LPS O-acetylase OafA/YrhL